MQRLLKQHLHFLPQVPKGTSALGTPQSEHRYVSTILFGYCKLGILVLFHSPSVITLHVYGVHIKTVSSQDNEE